MTTTGTGSEAEQAAAEYLQRQGFDVIERNFRTPRCEIDIIAQKGQRLYFVEVKYRSRDTQGGGLDYITARKQQQMQRAANIWLQQHKWDKEVTLAAIEVSANYEITEFLESIN